VLYDSQWKSYGNSAPAILEQATAGSLDAGEVYMAWTIKWSGTSPNTAKYVYTGLWATLMNLDDSEPTLASAANGASDDGVGTDAFPATLGDLTLATVDIPHFLVT